MPRTYLDPDSFQDISIAELGTQPPDRQIEVMRHWFYRNFEDPAKKTPYESSEGGYIWIWGGPYHAGEELHGEFAGVVEEEIIDDLAEELTGEATEWAPGPDHPVFSDHFVEVLASSVPFRSFRERMGTIEELAVVDYPPELAQAQYQLLLAAGISALEAYLVERAVRGVRHHEEVRRRFIETHPRFKEHKIPVAEVLKMASGVEQYAVNLLSRMVWHRLDEVRRVFEDAFEYIDFPNTDLLNEVIVIRHDIVHRAGVTEGGEAIDISVDELLQHLEAIRDFVSKLEPQLPIDDDADLDFGWPDGLRRAGQDRTNGLDV